MITKHNEHTMLFLLTLFVCLENLNPVSSKEIFAYDES